MIIRLGTLLMLASTACHAGGYTAFATPTEIDVVTNQGIMVYGAFGNPSSCTESNAFFVYFSNTQYSQMYAQILTAFTAGQKISVYVSECDVVSWYNASPVTYGALTNNSAVRIQN